MPADVDLDGFGSYLEAAVRGSMTRFKSRFLGYRDTLGPSPARLRCPVLALPPERDPLPQPDTAARVEYLRRIARTSSAASCPTRATGWPAKPPSR